VTTNDYVHDAVQAEEDRQVELWGEQNHPDGTGEDFAVAASMAKEACEAAFANGTGTWLDILVEEVFEAAEEADEEALIVELTQVAAVAKNWIRAIKRRQAARDLYQPVEQVAA
jgi:hypothetical protein